MAFERIWAQSLDNAQTAATALEETQRQLWSLKAMLLGQYGGLTGSGLWTIDSSCNSVTAGTQGDGVDRWHSGTFTASDIVRGAAGAAHSWFVLKSPSMGGFNFYLLISFDGAANTSASLLLAKTPFTGGTTTANPTSVDSWALVSAAAWNSGLTGVHRFSMLLSSTGDFWFLAIIAGKHTVLQFAAVLAVTGADTNDKFPIWGSFGSANDSTPTGPGALTSVSVISNASRTYAAAAATISFLCADRAVQGSNVGYDALTGGQLDQPCWLVVNASTYWHHRGRLPDCAMGYEDENGLVAPNGDSVNPGAGIIGVQLGCMILPLTVVPDLS